MRGAVVILPVFVLLGAVIAALAGGSAWGIAFHALVSAPLTAVVVLVLVAFLRSRSEAAPRHRVCLLPKRGRLSDRRGSQDQQGPRQRPLSG
jgi:membrane protein implicated in regulation of membrane protease activity